jgi:predicted kinase
MPKLIMTRGLPGSGKTYWAEGYKCQLEEQGLRVVIVCKDDIRAIMTRTGWQWSPEEEHKVIKLRNSTIKSAFAHGNHIVIAADTNFGKHKEALQGLAKACKVDFEVKDFTRIPIELCIERDAKRDKPVGAEVIKGMYNKYLAYETPVVYTPDTKLPLALICDLDGTIAIHKDRSPYDFGKCGTDLLCEPVANIVRLHAINGFTILYVSGRDNWCRLITEDWLQRNRMPVDVPHMLIMRPDTDKRKDYIVKLDLFNTHIRDSYNVRFVLDDRNQVVQMWRKLGLVCLQVNEGDF